VEEAEEVEEIEEIRPAEDESGGGSEELDAVQEAGALEPEELESVEEGEDLEPEDLEPEDLEPEEVEELEGLESDAEAEEPLELTGSRSQADVHMSDWFSFTRHGSSRLDEEDAEEAELIEDFEETIPEEPLGEELEEAGSEEPYRMEDDLIVFTSGEETDNSFFQILRLHGRADGDAEGERGVFTAADGVVEIDQRVYEEAHYTSDAEVRNLVESIVGQEEESESAGIDDLLAAGGGLDLLPVGQKEEAITAGTDAGGGPRKPIIDERGLDYDAILGAYPETEGGILKSLVEFTRAWGARAAGVLLPAEGEMRLDYSLAIEERCRRNFVVPVTSDVYRHVLTHRSLLLTREPLHRFRSFRGLCSESAFAYIGSVLLLPIVFRGTEAYLLLGVREGATSIEELLSNAGIRLPGAVSAPARS
jgi:hypothetical protein